ncbi:hypothetical protein DFH28DRAFT_926165 [Melampsora americana]|nr:hypothetical protein DFH28DRAFT_926165 [Melampsora americana]
MPELPSPDSKGNCLSQLTKWREELDRDLRVQMVDQPNGHFYLYEPVQLQSHKIVVPIFFIKWNHTHLQGNISKRWNKHLAFYFTLAGLPPKLANQEYNCHFVTTSNLAGALELADPLVDALNTVNSSKIATDGFVAYDHQTQKEVLIMTVVLCHLGDSPMHAEVTNTMNPTVSLTPCQISHLKVENMVNKRSASMWPALLELTKVDASWSETNDNTKELWELAQRPGTISSFAKESAKLGICDTLNMSFVKHVQDLHWDPTLSREDVAKMCCDLKDAYGEHLFNPFLQLKVKQDLMAIETLPLRYCMLFCWELSMINHFLSMTGKEFCTVLQAAPFIFFQCDLSDDKCDTWKALSHLAPYIFQPEITNMKSYIIDMSCHIDLFLQAIVELLAQWCNKPEFHMLIHLCDSVEQFGPACRFATETFKGYNGNTCNSSIHSNHLSPGRDIAKSFNNHCLIRSITSKALNYDRTLKSYIQASENVTNIFQNNCLLQKALGYNAEWNQSCHFKAGSKFIGRVKRVWGVGSHKPEECKLELSKCELEGISNFYSMCEVEETSQIVWINQARVSLTFSTIATTPEVRLKKCGKLQLNVESQRTRSLWWCIKIPWCFVLNSAAFNSAELHREWAQMKFLDVPPADWKSVIDTGIEHREENPKKTR